MRGDIARAQGDLRQAISPYTKTIEISPKHIPARLARARVLIQTDQESKALAETEVAREADGEDPQATYFYAMVMAKRGETAKTLDLTNESANILFGGGPAHARAHWPPMLIQGMIDYSLGNFEKARDNL